MHVIFRKFLSKRNEPENRWKPPNSMGKRYTLTYLNTSYHAFRVRRTSALLGKVGRLSDFASQFEAGSFPLISPACADSKKWLKWRIPKELETTSNYWISISNCGR